MSVVAATWSAAAEAESFCGAEIVNKFGEQRAYFADALGACSAQNGCSVVLQTPSQIGAAFGHRLRIAVARNGHTAVTLAAVEPMPATEPSGMALEFANVNFRFPSPDMWKSVAANEFQLTDGATNAALKYLMSGGRYLTWHYPQLDGRGNATVTFSMRGVTAALQWAECMNEGGRYGRRGDA